MSDDVSGERVAYLKLLTGSVMKERLQSAAKMHATVHGGLLNSAALALRLGELFASSVYGEEEMVRQRPLEVRDDGDRWTVFGSYNREMREGQGPVRVVLRKWDGAVLDVAIPEIYPALTKSRVQTTAAEQLERWLSLRDTRPDNGEA